MSADQELSLVERLRSNDATLTELRLTEAPVAYCHSFQEFLDALSVNTVIDYIRIDRDFLPCMTGGHTDVAAFFTALGRISSLKEVHIWHAAFAVSALLGFLNPTSAAAAPVYDADDGTEHVQKESKQQLDLLEFGCLELSGTTEEFRQVAAALQCHETLRVFHMVDFSFSTTDGLNSVTANSLDTFVSSLSQMPQLEVIKFEVTSCRRRSLCGAEAASVRPNVRLSGTAVATLIRTSKTIREIQFTRIPFTIQDYSTIADAVAASATLRIVALPHCEVTDDACNVLSPALTINNSLETIDLSCNKITDEGCICIASALKSNTSVKMLRLWGNVKISNAGFDALLDMLQFNVHLERVPLMAPYEYGTRIDAALLKNRSTAAAAAAAAIKKTTATTAAATTTNRAA